MWRFDVATVNKRTAGAAAKSRHADLDVFYFRES